MVAPQWCPDDRLESWGLSFQRFERFGRRVFGHGGGVLGGWNTMLWVSPSDDRAVIVHANCAFPEFELVHMRILAAALDARPRQADAAVAPEIVAAAPGVYEATPGALTNFRIAAGMGRLQIKATDDGLMLYARRGPLKRGMRLYSAGTSDPAFLSIDDGAVEPGRLALVCDGDRVTGLRCDRLVEMVRTEQVAPWV